MKTINRSASTLSAIAFMFAAFVPANSALSYSCFKDYSSECVTFNGCIASCSTKQCTWGGLPITLYLGLYANGTVYSPSAYVAYDEPGSMGTIPVTPTIAGEVRTETGCVLSVQPVLIAVPSCSGTIGDGSQCPAPVWAKL